MTNSSNDLALLIAAPQPGDKAMSRDQAAMTQALLARGLSADEILCLHGRLDWPLVIAFLQAAAVASQGGAKVRFSSTSAATASLPVIRRKRRGPACCSATRRT
jgi:hypothetical protein